MNRKSGHEGVMSRNVEVAAKKDNVNLGCITRSIVSKHKVTLHFL